MNPILRTISNVLNLVAPIVNIIGTIAYCADSKRRIRNFIPNGNINSDRNNLWNHSIKE